MRVIGSHSSAIDFITQLGVNDAEVAQDEIAKFLRRMGEYLNTNARGKQFGKADVYDNAKLNLPSTGGSLPGSRGKDNASGCTNVQNWSRFTQQERGEGGKGNTRNANVTNGGT